MLAVTGSSPLTRGKLDGRWSGERRGGLIPAHAGKTPGCGQRRRAMRAHPRSRGENTRTRTAGISQSGSSPLTRGKLRRLGRSRAGPGLIPAHAGKTAASAAATLLWRAHPRSRGENTDGAQCPCISDGSSPLTRGKPCSGMPVGVGSGLIPAHAGKTLTWRGRRARPGAPPRSRGENIGLSAPPCCVTGSSPLTRGKQVVEHDNLRECGLIPAHAGKTF